MIESIIKPLAPRFGLGWRENPPPPKWITMGYEGRCFYHPIANLAVISAVEVAKDDDGIDRGPEYHISISKRIPDGTLGGRGVRCTQQEALQVLIDFGIDGALEDNHVPNGIVRNFWRPVAENMVGLECACKADEPAIVENKGDYVWRGVSNG